MANVTEKIRKKTEKFIIVIINVLLANGKQKSRRFRYDDEPIHYWLNVHTCKNSANYFQRHV